tara:strand:- start:579 stop:1274 length:696 start_codon:yes stop_codon:yes gene_type:complete
MKVVILCGGLGSRLSEETQKKPKPMVKIGNVPILIHILKIYKKYGFNNFILATGYKHKFIEQYFKHNKSFNIRTIFTGRNTLTAGRVLKLKKYFKPGENFFLTYGDGISSHNIKKSLNFHIKNNKIATLTAVRPPVRFGELEVKKNLVKSFKEKPQARHGWINGGFFIFNYQIFNYIKKINIMLEREPMSLLVRKKNLACYKHEGFWQCMDTMRDKKLLEKMIKEKNTPWI